MTQHELDYGPLAEYEETGGPWYNAGKPHEQIDHSVTGPLVDMFGKIYYSLYGKRYTKEDWERHHDVVAYRLKQYALR